MNILITICARGGSKGIPGKNIHLVNGKPLIAYTIAHAKMYAEKTGADIELSTDNQEIKEIALKFGADFRVYDRGVKPGEDHARWVIYPVKEGEVLTWHDFAAKNRVAHSTKKRLMIGIVDDEGDVTYYEIRWMRP